METTTTTPTSEMRAVFYKGRHLRVEFDGLTAAAKFDHQDMWDLLRGEDLEVTLQTSQDGYGDYYGHLHLETNEHWAILFLNIMGDIYSQYMSPNGLLHSFVPGSDEHIPLSFTPRI